METSSPAVMEPVTFTLKRGIVVLGKMYKGKSRPSTYANRTQAIKAAFRAGPNWEVIQSGRPFFVAHVDSLKAPLTR